MVQATLALKVGEGNEPGVAVGPVQNSMQFEKVKTFFSEIEKEKWNVAVGGKQDLGRGGYFLEPTIIDRPPMDSKIITEEPFGKFCFLSLSLFFFLFFFFFLYRLFQFLLRTY